MYQQGDKMLEVRELLVKADGEELDHLADLVRADGTWVYYGVPAENFFIVTWMPDAEAAEAKVAALREEGDCVACCVDLAEEWNFG